MPLRLRERRHRRREDERKRQDQDDRIRLLPNGTVHGGVVQQPDGHHEQDQDQDRDEHGDALGDAAAVVVVDRVVVGPGAGFLM